MKKNIFEETYAKVQALKEAYDEAEKANDEDCKNELQKKHKELMMELSSQGTVNMRIWNMYEEAKDCGNKYIDLNEVIWEEQVETTIKTLRENGIEHFTFSSTWSNAVETAWLFTQNGCRLEGLIEINTKYKDFRTGKNKKAHGYLFKVN